MFFWEHIFCINEKIFNYQKRTNYGIQRFRTQIFNVSLMNVAANFLLNNILLVTFSMKQIYPLP